MKGYKTETYVSKAEWLVQHQVSIGGSSAGTILGVNPWQTKLELYKSIVSPAKKVRDTSKNANIIIGQTCEPLIRDTFKVMFPNLDVIDPNGWETYRSLKYPFMIATLDGRLREKTGKKRWGILEIKAIDIRSRKDFDLWFEFNPITNKYVVKQIKPTYFAQIIHYFNVMNDHKFAYFAIQFRFFNWNSPLENKVEHLETHYIYIERAEVEESCKNLLKLELAFMDDVKNRRIPKCEIKLKGKH